MFIQEEGPRVEIIIDLNRRNIQSSLLPLWLSYELNLYYPSFFLEGGRTSRILDNILEGHILGHHMRGPELGQRSLIPASRLPHTLENSAKIHLFALATN